MENIVSLHARRNSNYDVWSYKKKYGLKVTENPFRKNLQNKAVISKFNAILIIGQRKAFYRDRIPESSCERKETVDIDILITSRNGYREIMQSIRIATATCPARFWYHRCSISTQTLATRKNYKHKKQKSAST